MTSNDYITGNGSSTATKRSSITVNRNGAAPPIELSENFYIINKRKSNVKIQVKLNGAGIYLRRETEESDQINEQLIRLEDIIGSRYGLRIKKNKSALRSCKRISDVEDDGSVSVGANGEPQKDSSAYLYIYAYVKREKPFRRNQTVRILRFRTHETYEQNLKIAERWHHGIRINKDGSHNWAMERRQLLILLNPKSGSGKSRQLFQNQVAPVLKEAELSYDLQITTHPNFARDLVRTRKDLLKQYSGILIASGDGLFYEVLNGLMERNDWRLVSQHMPLGIIPCGSGNGLAKSIAHLYNEPYEPKPILHATLACVSGKTTPMDIVRIEFGKSAKSTEIYSFLSVGWGLIADVDIESERLRSLGAKRFTLWTINRLISLRTYKGKLWYLPWEKESNDKKVSINNHNEANDNVTINNGNCYEDVKLQNEFVDTREFHDILEIPEVDLENDDEFEDAMSLNASSHLNVNSWNSAISRQTAYFSLGGQSSIRSRRSILSKIETANAELEAKPPTATIPPLSMPLSTDTWRYEEGEYVMAKDRVYANNPQTFDLLKYLNKHPLSYGQNIASYIQTRQRK
ncbi:sphingosine kinase 2-like [Teleopsis dalmanni]|uniref:sphingosine kinase 2-like n=1 Tax=Teleopsis dalmanni TaxID=139649 RepID=UPI0018CF391F|nr:sphingosine kinase 2-like [Teleopsis dalmanni]